MASKSPGWLHTSLYCFKGIFNLEDMTVRTEDWLLVSFIMF
jgi:hypothetical protein